MALSLSVDLCEYPNHIPQDPINPIPDIQPIHGLGGTHRPLILHLLYFYIHKLLDAIDFGPDHRGMVEVLPVVEAVLGNHLLGELDIQLLTLLFVFGDAEVAGQGMG